MFEPPMVIINVLNVVSPFLHPFPIRRIKHFVFQMIFGGQRFEGQMTVAAQHNVFRDSGHEAGFDVDQSKVIQNKVGFMPFSISGNQYGHPVSLFFMIVAAFTSKSG